MATEKGAAGPTPLLQSLRDNRKLVAVVLSLSTSIFLTGFDNVILNSVSGMPAFQYAPNPTSQPALTNLE